MFYSDGTVCKKMFFFSLLVQINLEGDPPLHLGLKATEVRSEIMGSFFRFTRHVSCLDLSQESLYYRN